MMESLPAEFCWSKIGVESGQPLEAILARKEIERAAGQGVFYWGIGQALGHRFYDYITHSRKPIVAFSPMVSKAKNDDQDLDSVVRWNCWVDGNGEEYSLPRHVLITSKKQTPRGIKQQHYALVCKSKDPLSIGSKLTLNTGQLINYKRGTPLGHSQVTSIVQQYSERTVSRSRCYSVAVIAELVPPYFVKLTTPTPFLGNKVRQLNSITSNKPWCLNEWMEYIA